MSRTLLDMLADELGRRVLYRTHGCTAELVPDGIKLTRPGQPTYIYRVVGVPDLAGAAGYQADDLRLPLNSANAPGTSDIPALGYPDEDPTKINSQHSEAAFTAEELDGGGSGVAHRPDSPPPAAEPPRRRQRFLGDPDRGWSPAPLPRGLPW
jgi:hypothetical protein